MRWRYLPHKRAELRRNIKHNANRMRDCVRHVPHYTLPELAQMYGAKCALYAVKSLA